jgi:hypothetical protein
MFLHNTLVGPSLVLLFVEALDLLGCNVDYYRLSHDMDQYSSFINVSSLAP